MASTPVFAPTVGILTTLAVEAAAVRALVDDAVDARFEGDPLTFWLGTVPSADPDQPHQVVVGQTLEGGSSTAVGGDLARRFPSLHSVVLCGISGGVPAGAPGEPAVHLGDVVVATEGVVDYGYVRAADGRDRPRRSTTGMSLPLLRADREVQAAELAGATVLGDLLDAVPAAFALKERHVPRVHRGAVASGDRLIRDTRMRDALAVQYGVRAVEMEGLGFTAGVGLRGLTWFVVRGVADFGDVHKDDSWHLFAAAAAAAYTRVLLGKCPPFAGPPSSVRGDPSLQPLAQLVDALVQVDVMRDDYERRAVVTALPAPIRLQVREYVEARLYVLGLVRTCMQFPGGLDALMGALQLVVADSVALRRVTAAVDALRASAS